MITPLIQIYEHFDSSLEDSAEVDLLSEVYYFHRFKRYKKQDYYSYKLEKRDHAYYLQTSYFVGLDWLEKEKCALYIAPKLNNNSPETDFIRMLFDCMRHPIVADKIKELYTIKWNETPIAITQQQDLLTPFLITEFLSILKQIVRKGLKKSYYKVDRKLNSRIKGKINIGRTVKHQLSKQRMLETACTFDEFGIDHLENRILKKALVFIKRYLPNYTGFRGNAYLQSMSNYITPAFEKVGTNVSIREIKTFKSNAFYKEYDEGLRLAKLILKRFGYNITKTSKQEITTPPFWIDMSRLFELYVLGLLKDRFGNTVTYHFTADSTEVDYLLNSEEKDDDGLPYKMVIDAKYKLKYEGNGRHIEDVRQVSGYARLKKVHEELSLTYPSRIDCLIIYPKRHDNKEDFAVETLHEKKLRQSPIKNYHGIYKIGVRLPKIKTNEK
ncbi:MAG: McrC family protein [Bacteroidetes bacterium]|nr:McrC family protein [Bacteroidota bacterium]